MEDKNVTKILVRLGQMRSRRYNFENQWQDIRELVRVNTSDFNRSRTEGDRRADKIFDGTAPWANEQFSAGLHSYLTPSTERWFNLDLENHKVEQLSDEELVWLEVVSDILFREFARPTVNLNPALHEIYQDLGAFGTAVLYEDWDDRSRSVSFRAFPLADCYIDENSRGLVNVVYRKIIMTLRQILDEFSGDEDSVPDKLRDEKKNLEATMTVIHAVEPRDIERPGYGPKNKRFKSCWILEEEKHMLRERGYDEMPYHVVRWVKLSGELYGRSPAMTCLPDIKMINTMSKVVIVAAQKLVDPPLIVPDDGFILPIKTSPGSLIFKAAGQEDTIQPLQTGGNVNIGLDMMDQRRTMITQAFYIDWILRQKKRERQTATEIVDDRNEMLRQLSPMLGRTQVELLSPIIGRTYNLKTERGHIPPAPGSMQGKNLSVTYVSPAARAQYGSKATAIQMFLQDIATITPFSPTAPDIIDPDALVQELSKLRDVTRKILRSPEAVAQIRAARAQQEQLATMVAAGGEIASAAKDVSIAKKNGLS